MVLSNPKFSDLILGTVIFLESMQFPLYPMVLIPLYVDDIGQDGCYVH